MKKSLTISLAIVVALLLCPLLVFAKDVSCVVNANNQFASELYSQYKSKDGNIFFSPYSISSAIAMTYEGARGKTADEIQSTFHFPKDGFLRRESFLKINNLINKKNERFTLRIANALWAQKEYKFFDDYSNLVSRYYGGKITSLDFINQVEASRQIINHWVEKQTDDQIKDLVPQGVINSLTRLVLTNAVYFKGFWRVRFNKQDTRDENFRTTAGDTIKVPMMQLSEKKAEFNYAETDNCQILELLYEGEDLSMLIFLPKMGDLKIVEESLSAEKFSQWKSLLKKEEVKVFLPRFKFETKYLLANDLGKMGMPLAFSDLADFSGMGGKTDLRIQEIIHKAFIDVNEEGTEAAAATAVIMVPQGISIATKTVKIFRADHPFIFLVLENETGNVLFMGRVSNPIK